MVTGAFKEMKSKYYAANDGKSLCQVITELVVNKIKLENLVMMQCNIK